MFICRYAEGVHVQRKVGNPWSTCTEPWLKFPKTSITEADENWVTLFVVATQTKVQAFLFLNQCNFKYKSCIKRLLRAFYATDIFMCMYRTRDRASPATFKTNALSKNI